MRTLKAATKIKKHEFIAYRSNVYLNFLFGCVPLFFSILLWKAIYGSNTDVIGGYSYKQIITYYVIAFLLSQIINVRETTVEMSEMIQSGNIHNYMLKPIGFFSLNFKLFLAEKLVFFLNIFIPYSVFCLLIHQYIFVNVKSIPFFVLSIWLAFILKYIIGCILGLLTTWVEEISGLLDFWDNIENFFSGGLLPLSIFPVPLYRVVSLLPFKYFLFVPIDIYMGEMQIREVVVALTIQIAWIVILGLLLHIIKLKAYKKYSGYGT